MRSGRTGNLPTIFLSYGRRDDVEPYEPATSFVARLTRDLRSAGFDVWFDRESMPSRSLTFHQEIRDAVAARDRLVLVVGPYATNSEYVRQEWQFAYFQADKIVTPILRLGDYATVPRELNLLHCEDFRDDCQYEAHLGHLVRQLHDPAPRLGKLIAVPNLPRNFLSRTERLISLRSSLRVDLDGPIVIGHAAARVGIHGMGGIGKSVLAAALARDRKVREAFPDGVVWIGLGLRPGVAELIQRVYNDLGGDADFATEHEGRVALKELLERRAVLLVLDDAWRRQDVEAFDVLGSRCRALITTRDSALLRHLDVQHAVELLTHDEALNMLAVTAGVPRDELPVDAPAVVAECGRLPLAVTLCGGMVRAGRTFAEVASQLQLARIDRIADRHAIEAHHQSLWQAIHVSVESLLTDARVGVANAAGRFLELGVFNADEQVPVAAAVTLWADTGSLDDWDALGLLILLGERSLLQVSAVPAPNSAVVVRQFSIHAVVRDYARLTHGDPTVLNRLLLAAYERKCSAGWANGPDDGYFFRHLPRHICYARGPAALKDLLLNLGWIKKKLEVAGLSALVLDYTLSPDDAVLTAVKDALLLSGHSIQRHPQRVEGELGARLTASDYAQLTQGAEVDGKPKVRLLNRARSVAIAGSRLVRTLIVSEGDIKDICATGDGKYVIAALDGAGVAIIDVAGGIVVRSCATTATVSALAASQDGSLIAIAVESVVELRSIETTEVLARYEGHTSTIFSVGFSFDGRHLVSLSYDNTVRVWPIGSDGKSRIIAARPHDKEHLFSLGGLYLAHDRDDVLIAEEVPGAEHGVITNKSVATGEQRWQLPCCPSPRLVAMSQNGRFVACTSGLATRSVMLIDLQLGSSIYLEPSIPLANKLMFIGDGRHLVVGVSFGGLLFWEPITARLEDAFEAHYNELRGLAALDRNHVVSAASSEMKLWKNSNPVAANAAEAEVEAPQHKGPIACLTIDEGLLIAGSYDGSISVWDIATLQCRCHFHAHKGGVASVAGNRSTGFLVSGGLDGRADAEIRTWSIQDPSMLRQIALDESRAWSVAVVGDKNYVVVGDIFDLIVWQLPEWTKLHQLRFRPDAMKIGAPKGQLDYADQRGLCPLNGETVAVGLKGGMIQTWDIIRGVKLLEWSAHDGEVRCVVSMMSGRRLASASSDGTVKIWNSATGARVDELPRNSTKAF
jgi:WD40 repeat protein